MPYTATAAEDTKQKWVRFKVDLWATDLNDVELGIMKQTQNEAASHQFTKDMEIIGAIKEDGQRTGIIGYRKSLWKESQGAKRRLVIKLFSDTMNWRGSLDMMVGRSLQLTHGADGVPAPAFSINLARHDQVIPLERSAHVLPMVPEKFSFFILTDDGPRYYRLRRDRIALGADYTLYGPANEKIGHLDGKLINLGGAWKVKLSPAHDDVRLKSVIQLFCAMLRFNRGCRRHVQRLSSDMDRGKGDLTLCHNEADLYMNPRRTR
ncbi:MAG: hypothetical protein AAF216_06685 [Pseudomonadota bacterium]